MTLHLPGTSRPTNLHLTPEQLSWELDGETMNWLSKLPDEVDGGDRLFVVIHEDHEAPFVIMENADDGVAMFVMRCSRLDQSVFDRLRYIKQVPLSKRIEAFDKEAEKHDADKKQAELDELYERIGGPMYRDLHRHGFAHGRSENYAKAGPRAKKLWKGSR